MLRLSPGELDLVKTLAKFDRLKMAGAIRNAVIVAARLAAGERNFSREPFEPEDVESECKRLAEQLLQRLKKKDAKAQ